MTDMDQLYPNTFSFRAEFRGDAYRFFAELEYKGLGAEITQFNLEVLEGGYVAPGVLVEFKSNAEKVEDFLAVTEQVPGIHVVRQTVRRCPLSENSLERNPDVF